MSSSMSEDDDCVIVAETYRDKWFFPVDKSWQASKCQQFNLPLIGELTVNVQQPLPALAPIRLRNVRGDGNCFFRCISYCITGEEYYHLLIRQILVKFMDDHPELVGKMVDNVHYTFESQIWVNGKWPTEVEIYLSARLLETNIFTYKDNAWLVFGGQGRLEMNDTHERAIYLLNSNNHYQVVLGVGEPPSPTSCLRPTAIEGATDGEKENQEEMVHSSTSNSLTLGQLPREVEVLEEPPKKKRCLRSYSVRSDSILVTTGVGEPPEKNDHPPHAILKTHSMMDQQPTINNRMEEPPKKKRFLRSSSIRSDLTLEQIPTTTVGVTELEETTDKAEEPRQKQDTPPSRILRSFLTTGQRPT